MPKIFQQKQLDCIQEAPELWPPWVSMACGNPVDQLERAII